MNRYEQQWATFAVAKRLGWKGDSPGVLGTSEAKKRLKEAEQYLQQFDEATRERARIAELGENA
jgi:hypothetical protein